MGPGEAFYSLVDLLFLGGHRSWTRRSGTASACRDLDEAAVTAPAFEHPG
jgi:hypothetical protein